MSKSSSSISRDVLHAERGARNNDGERVVVPLFRLACYASEQAIEP